MRPNATFGARQGVPTTCAETTTSLRQKLWSATNSLRCSERLLLSTQQSATSTTAERCPKSHSSRYSLLNRRQSVALDGLGCSRDAAAPNVSCRKSWIFEEDERVASGGVDM